MIDMWSRYPRSQEPLAHREILTRLRPRDLCHTPPLNLDGLAASIWRSLSGLGLNRGFGPRRLLNVTTFSSSSAEVVRRKTGQIDAWLHASQRQRLFDLLECRPQTTVAQVETIPACLCFHRRNLHASPVEQLELADEALVSFPNTAQPLG